MEKIRVYMDDPETGERKYGSVTVDKLSVALAKGFKVAEQQATPVAAAPVPPSAAPAAPAAAPMTEAPAAPAEEGGGFVRGLKALATGAGRGLTADFLDEIAGIAAAAGGQIGGRLAGVPSEFLAQEDFYTQGREEEQARQRRLEQESPLLTMAGQVAGALPYAAAAPAAAPATFGARFAQAAPAALAYGAASGLGQTDIKSPDGPTADVPLDLAKNIAIGGGAGMLGAAGGAAVGTAASGLRGYIAKKLAEFGKEADELRVATAGPAALKAAKKGQGGVDVKETARVMREVGLGGVKAPSAIKAGAEKTEEEAGALIGRIVDEVDAASGGFLRKAQDARSQAAQLAEQIDSVVAQKQATADETRRLVSLATEKLERAREAQNISVLRGGKKAMTKQEAMQVLQSHAENPEAIDATAVAQARSVVSMPAGAPAPTDGAAYNKMLAGLKADVDELTKRADAASREVIAARNTDQSKAVADLIKQAEQAEAQASTRRVSGDEVAKRLEAEASSIVSRSGRPVEKLVPIDKKNYDALLSAAERSRGLSLTLKQAQESLAPLARQAKFEKAAPDEAVVGGALAAREESRALREGMDIAAEEAFPTMAATPALESPLARVGKGARLTEPPTGKTGYQSARRVYDVMQDIVPSVGAEAERLAAEKLLPRLKQSYMPALKATASERAQTMAPKAETAFLTPQERILRSLPYGAESFADMLRQIDEESAP